MTNFLLRNPKFFFGLIRFWPPYVAAGVSVTHTTEDLREIDVQMKLHYWNKNVVGTQFGGSLYTMIDPWFVMMLIHNLGKGYIVWDKAATIRFKRPGEGTVYAKCRIFEEQILSVREEANREGKSEPQFRVDIVDGAGRLVAEADKIISVRRKDFVKNKEQNK